MTGNMRIVASAALGLFAATASAQSISEPTEAATLKLPFGAVPAEIFGVPCQSVPARPHFAPYLECKTADPMARPSISISVADWRGEPSQADMIASMRESFHDRSIFKFHEVAFAPPGDPMAVGFRGRYQTDLGNRYVWAVRTGGKMIRVIVIAFAPFDVRAMTADIEWKIFGVPVP